MWGMSTAVNMHPVRLAKGLHQRLQLIRLVKSAQQAASVHKQHLHDAHQTLLKTALPSQGEDTVRKSSTVAYQPH
jgi:hypothetical protein